MKEIFKDILGYEGFYQVSNLGRVKSFARTLKRKNGISYNLKEKILQPCKMPRGYLSVDLHGIDKRESYKISVLMAVAFLNHIPCGHDIVVDHVNNIPNDNRINNLQLITTRENNTKDKKPKSGLTGVHYIKRLDKWVATVCSDCKTKYLGAFDNKEEAHKYYKNAVTSILSGTEIRIKKAIFSSKYKGVSWCKKRNLWIAVVRIKNKTRYLGSSKDEIKCYKIVTDFLIPKGLPL